MSARGRAHKPAVTPKNSSSSSRRSLWRWRSSSHLSTWLASRLSLRMTRTMVKKKIWACAMIKFHNLVRPSIAPNRPSPILNHPRIMLTKSRPFRPSNPSRYSIVELIRWRTLTCKTTLSHHIIGTCRRRRTWPAWNSMSFIAGELWQINHPRKLSLI